MKRPRFQFTIGRLVQIVALAAFGCYLIRVGLWGLVLAWPIAGPGFVRDRVRGGSGLWGSVMAGLLGFALCGAAFCAYSCLFLGTSGSMESAGGLISGIGMIGLLGGATFGAFAWTLLSLESLIGWLWTRWSLGPRTDRRDEREP